MKNKYIEILKASTKLGLTSFGGPAAHIGYFREEYVEKRKWLDDKLYADIVAFVSFYLDRFLTSRNLYWIIKRGDYWEVLFRG